MPAVKEAIDRMSTAEKVDVMNYLWVALSKSGKMFVPVWHIANSQGEDEPVLKRVSQYGALKGKVEMTPDFDAPIEDFAEYM